MAGAPLPPQFLSRPPWLVRSALRVLDLACWIGAKLIHVRH